jgi:hypothetical protein
VFEEDPRVADLRASATAPLPWTVGVAPVAFSFSPEEANRSARGRWSLPPPARELEEGVLQALRTVGLFKSAEAIEGPPGSGPEDHLREAWGRELDFLVQVEVRKWDVAYAGTNGWFLPNLLLAFQFWIPAWFVPDETYAAEAAAIVTVKSVHSGRTVLEERIEFSVREGLDDFQRGWIFLGLFRVPGALDRTNWESVGEVLQPRTAHEFKVELARRLSGALRARAGEPEWKALLRKKLALVIGTQNYRHHRFPQAVFGRADAESVHEFLVDPAQGGLPRTNVRFLPGEAATAANVRKGVSEFLVRRAREGDEVFLHFSGFGCLAPAGKGAAPGAPSRRWIVPYDADPDDVPGSSIDLEWVLEQLRACPAKAVVILDTSFKPGGGKRSFHPPGTPVPPEAPPPALPRNLTVIGACASSQECGALEDRERGMFSYFLVQGFSRKADANDDGKVTLQEAFLYVRENTEIQAFVEGAPEQSPFLAGQPAGSVVMATWR